MNTSEPGVTDQRASGFVQWKRLYKYEYIAIAIALIGIIVFNFLVSPFSFKTELLSQISRDGGSEQALIIKRMVENNFFLEIYKPYFIYIFYSIGFWLGLCLATSLVILRGFIPDWSELKSKRNEIKRSCLLGNFDPDDRKLVSVQANLSMFNAKLREISGKYIPIFFILIVALLIESRTNSSTSVTTVALETSRIIAFLVILLLLASMFILIIEHQKVIKIIDYYLGKSLKTWLASGELGEDTELIERYTVFRQDLTLSQNSLDFFLSTVKNASFVIPLLAAVLFYLIESIAGSDWTFLIPNSILDILNSLYNTE